MDQRIIIEKDGTILAQHTNESYLSHYDQPVWVIEEEEPDPGRVVWRQGKKEQYLDFLGVVDGWFIAAQSDGNLVGIIWSDGSYYANLIVQAGTGQVADRTALDNIDDGTFQVIGTVPMGILGCL